MSIVAVTTFILILSGSWDYVTTSKEMKIELDNMAGNTVERLAKNLVSPLWDVDEAQLEEAVQSEMLEKRIFGVLVKDPAGQKITLGKKRDENWEVVTTMATIEEAQIMVPKDIEKDGEKLGVVEIYISTKFMSEALSKSGITIGLTIIILNAILGSAVFLITRKVIVTPINVVRVGLKDIAQGEGDLTMRLDVKSEDEVGSLAKWFNTFMGKLHEIIKDISQNSDTINQASAVLFELSEQMTEGADSMSAKSGMVATGAEEMSANMVSVAAAMEEASTNISLVAAAAEEMNAVINEIASNSEKARTITGDAVGKASSASEKVGELGTAAQDIGNVTEVINDISEQTNLLALNATIEAARAGEAGKGFAVVANEIKELAKQTAEATKEIKSKIEGIQNTTAGTVTEISEVSTVINDINEIVATIATAVEEQSVTTKEIANNVGQASDGIGEVNENVSQATTVVNDITKDIAEVSVFANDMSSSSGKVKTNADELSTLAGQLKGMVGKFKI